MAIAVISFIFPHTMNTILEESLTDRVSWKYLSFINLIFNIFFKIITLYRDDPDLQNLIDFVQQEFSCCGLTSGGFLDWSKNEYFNCSSPSVERCGVPYSCCINSTDISSGLINIMCGYGVQSQSVSQASKKIWTSGCIEIVRVWAERNLYLFAGVALTCSFVQLLIIYLAKTLEGQIELQKARWTSSWVPSGNCHYL